MLFFLCAPTLHPASLSTELRLLQVFGNSPDETAYCRMQLNRETTPEAMLMIQVRPEAASATLLLLSCCALTLLKALRMLCSSPGPCCRPPVPLQPALSSAPLK